MTTTSRFSNFYRMFAGAISPMVSMSLLLFFVPVVAFGHGEGGHGGLVVDHQAMHFEFLVKDHKTVLVFIYDKHMQHAKVAVTGQPKLTLAMPDKTTKTIALSPAGGSTETLTGALQNPAVGAGKASGLLELPTTTGLLTIRIRNLPL